MTLGHFSLELSVLNSYQSNPLSKMASVSEGSYGQIYTFRFLQERIAVKSLCFTGENVETIQIKIRKAIR